MQHLLPLDPARLSGLSDTCATFTCELERELDLFRFLAQAISATTPAAMPPKKGPVELPPMLGRPGNSVSAGLVGLPNVGKSTTFNVLCSQNVAAENFPFCTIDPSTARVKVPDERFEELCNKYQPASKVPAWLTVVDSERSRTLSQRVAALPPLLCPSSLPSWLEARLLAHFADAHGSESCARPAPSPAPQSPAS
jgi:hypothetical protein